LLVFFLVLTFDFLRKKKKKKLFTDSAGGSSKGCGAYFAGKWVALQWPEKWNNTEVLKDITYLELIPIILAIFIWGNAMKHKKVIFFSDNEAVVFILNNKSSKSERVMSLLRPLVYLTLVFNIQFRAKHLFSFENKIADSISRGQVARFRELAPTAEEFPSTIPAEFWNLLC